ncbi:PAS domain-containing protein [Telluribacter humicola]|uniref:PAS domain-containing protein n=1 Tax=Telluribacter humicola TaxID=1720261 RepID=UPI001A964971|nr:PAS domain-containing protein [Telluribacter humicola]
MLDLSPKTNCDTFTGIRTTTPLLLGMEFFSKPTRQDEWEELQAMQMERDWLYDLDQAKSYLRGRKKAIVVTDSSQQIIWTSLGFTRMTGYTFCEVYHKRPSFLQGEKTQPEIRSKIRECLTEQEVFKGSIINYRKSGQFYTCDVHILPIFNKRQELVNFMALEEEK